MLEFQCIFSWVLRLSRVSVMTFVTRIILVCCDLTNDLITDHDYSGYCHSSTSTMSIDNINIQSLIIDTIFFLSKVVMGAIAALIAAVWFAADETSTA